MRNIQFANEEYYHIYNRGVDKRNIFACQNDYERFLICMDLVNDERNGVMEEWRNFLKANPRAKLSDFRKFRHNQNINRLVELNVYCLNPNHIHFELRQLRNNGIRYYMHKLSTSYTNYFNTKYERSGSLFQGPFKSIHIDSNEYLLYLSAYINHNHFIHGYGENPWEYSSLLDYLGKKSEGLCSVKPILSQFDNNIKEYERFACDNALYMKGNKESERYLFE